MFSSKTGFTIVELGIAIGVGAVLATLVTSAVIEKTRSDVTERAVEEVIRIQEAARWAYDESSTRWDDARWPGQTGTACTGNAGNVLRDNYVERGLLDSNPWNRAYDVTVVESAGAGAGNCRLRVRTDVPVPVAGMFSRRLPFGECGAVTNGFQSCWSDIPPPGAAIAVNAIAAYVPPPPPPPPGGPAPSGGNPAPSSTTTPCNPNTVIVSAGNAVAGATSGCGSGAMASTGPGNTASAGVPVINNQTNTTSGGGFSYSSSTSNTGSAVVITSGGNTTITTTGTGVASSSGGSTFTSGSGNSPGGLFGGR
jgi:type II secretory pathway pseudopilin PulG